jgi:membrane protein YqaA with SNARE-associated domain
MLKNLYMRVLALSASRHAAWWLAVVSFVESSFFPIPPDVLLVPMVATRPDRAWWLALICTVSSVLGGLLGYAIGFAFYDAVALPLIRFYHFDASAEAFVASMRTYGMWIILVKGLTPIPFKLVTIACGIAHLNLLTFVLACCVTRGSRFFIEAALLRRYGGSVLQVVEQRLALVTVVTVFGVVAGFVVLKLL